MAGKPRPWVIEGSRASFFIGGSAKASARDLWAQLIGDPPQDLVTQEGPVGQGAATGTATSGVSGQILIRPSRVDVLLNVVTKLDQKSGSASLEVEADAYDAISAFVGQLKAAPQLLPNCHRLALGTVARWDVASKTEAYKTLQALLSRVQIDPDASSDFLYQINRPRPSSVVKDLAINRLSKWAYITLRAVVSAAEGLGPITATANFLRAEIDVNTAAENAEIFSLERVSSLLEELGALSREILASGDVP